MTKYYEIQKAQQDASTGNAVFQFVDQIMQQHYKISDMFHRFGELIPYHTHSTRETIIITKGNLRTIVEEDILDLAEGDILIIEPWAIHLICTLDREGCHYLHCLPSKSTA
jgi:quercetin dioxygenase-like cupin family protein